MGTGRNMRSEHTAWQRTMTPTAEKLPGIDVPCHIIYILQAEGLEKAF